MLDIQSAKNPRVKRLIKLRTARGRRQHDRFLVEGARELRRAVECGVTFEEVYVSASALQAAQQAAREERPSQTAEGLGDVSAVLSSAASVPIVQVADTVWEKLVVRGSQAQVLGVGRPYSMTLADLPAMPNEGEALPLVVVLEGVEKPGNVGAILRSADAAGAWLLLAEPRCELLNPNAIRASLGAVFSVPCAAGSNDEVAQFLDHHGFEVFAARLDAEATAWDCDLRNAAILLGSEANGISQFWHSRSQGLRLPMRGVCDSLNVAATGAVLMFESVRQRLMAPN